MIGPTNVNRRKRRHFRRAKDADRLQPKGKQQGCSTGRLGHTDIMAAGVEAGTTSLVVDPTDIAIRRYVKVKSNVNPFDPLWRGYFESRKRFRGAHPHR